VKFIIINRKRLGITVILLGLMVILFGLGKTFDTKLKDASLIYNNINSLVKYEGLDNSFSYMLPEEWTAAKENMDSTDITYHNGFVSADKKIKGFVQVWNYEGDLNKFLEKSKESSLKPQANKYKEYLISTINLNKDKAYLLKYTVDAGNKNYYKGNEYFIKGAGKFYRFSFFVKASDYKETMGTMFENIVKTLSIKQ
jgi:hypothetical protein